MASNNPKPELIIGSATSLPPNKRYIATHNGSGKSVYADSPDQQFWAVPSVGGMARSYAVPSVPVVMKDDADLKAYRASDGPTSHTRRDIVVPNGGANLVVVDLAPGGVSGMHHTVSIDFSICTHGTVDHQLDGGETVRLHPGDHIVQRGTTHRWINVSKTEPARFVAVTLGAEPFDIPGKGMLKEWHGPPETEEASKL